MHMESGYSDKPESRNDTHLKLGSLWTGILTVFLTVCALPDIFLTAQESNQPIWASGTAYVMPEKRLQVGLFQPLRHGWSKSIEFSTHPLWFFVIPNAAVKWQHGTMGNTVISTRHSFSYPTPLLRTLSREGTGGIISPEFEIPHMFSINNELLLSRTVLGNHLLTGKAGLAVGLRFGELDERTTIDLPLVYNRLAPFYHGYQLRAGIDLQGQLYGRWHYQINADYFYIPAVHFNKAFESLGLILWNKSPATQYSIGYKLSYGQYPFGSQWHLFVPVFDIQKAWKP